MNTRLKELRQKLGLSQTAFADALNVSRNFIGLCEVGDRNLSDRTIIDICTKFHVSEEWFRTGVGNMFVPITREIEIAEIVAKIYKEDDPFRRSLIRILIDMNEDQIKLLKDMAKRLVEEMGKENLSE